MNDSDRGETKDEQRRRDDQLEDRKSEATSDETLRDLEETETNNNSTETGLDPGPSPDGLLEQPDEGGRMKDEG